jgi:hypothetical protein
MTTHDDVEKAINEFEKEFWDNGDERYGWVKHNNTIVQRQIDWLRTALTAMYEKGLRDGREPYIIRDVAIDLRAQVNERDNQ